MWLRRIPVIVLSSVFVLGLVMSIAGGVKLDTTVLSLPGLLAMGPVGAVLASKRPGNAIGWLFLTIAAVTTSSIWAGDVVQDRGDTATSWSGAPVLALWLYNFAWFPVLVMGTVMVPLLFPQGWLSAKWRTFGVALIVWYSSLLALASVAPTLQLDNGSSVSNPLSPSWAPDAIGHVSDNVVGISLFVGVMAGVLSVGLRYWRGSPNERVQIRWFVTAIGFVLAGAVLAAATQGWIADLALGLAAALIPIATWIAITRHGLYDIDRIISRTLAYSLVTGAVIGIYAVLVTTITRLLPVSSALAVTVATLGAAAVFQPLLRTTRTVIDRRFNREHYDALETVDGFAASLQSTVDSAALHQHLDSAVTKTLQPSRYTLWTKQ